MFWKKNDEQRNISAALEGIGNTGGSDFNT